MAAPRFSIGIDLGTTNCAMAYTPLDAGDAVSEVFQIPQRESLERLADAPTLPSFLYLPTEQEASRMQAEEAVRGAEWIAGRHARRRAGETPGRVAHSAKSWLGHHAVDRGAAFLPWGSEEIPPAAKISPIRASALLLNYLRGAWDARMAAPFDAQDITITVPASFDAVAQRLTLDAAAEAGFSKSVRLLEEPQAAFYRWLEAHREADALWSQLPPGQGARHVLVVDVGGGTSDFSLFEVARQQSSPLPAIRRVAVSEHLLLGGDNIDLAIAHLLEPRFVGKDDKLAGSQWDDLVARSRDLKERCLGADGTPDEEFPISLPGRGSNLFAGTLSAVVVRSEIDAILLDGFFPECPANAKPAEASAALLEWGLPYAADSAVTRYLAAFLRDLPKVDAILFNGGSLYPEMLRRRLRDLLGTWQDGQAPRVLDNPEPDLAVARGAARYGAILHHRAARIESGAARSIYLEVHTAGGGSPALLCLLPRGAAPGEPHPIAVPDLRLRVNRMVRFQCYHSTRRDKDRAGAMVARKDGDFHKLPPLQAVARLDNTPGGAENLQIPVTLSARLTELGLLELECASADPGIRQTWPLAFDLRAAESREGVAESDADPGVVPAALDAAGQRIVAIFSKHFDQRDPLSATRLLKHLEETLGQPKAQWNIFLIRALWGSLNRCFPCRVNSVDHEETWLILAGYFLRPGFGGERDPVRIDNLWRLRSAGLANPGKRVKLQEYILWRRVAGGLDRARQMAVLETEPDILRGQKNPPAEWVRMAGSFERLEPDVKSMLVDLFLAKIASPAGQGAPAAPYFAALGAILNRTPFHAGPEAVVPPDLVAKVFDALGNHDWKASPELCDLFLRAARVTGNRSLDLPRPLRKDIARKLEKADVSALKVARIEEFVPIARSERASLFGESLPPGLVLAGEP